MSVEALAMLMAAVIQGQVLWVYNKDRDQACLSVDQTQQLPHSTLSPHGTAQRETVTAYHLHTNTTLLHDSIASMTVNTV